MNKKNIGFMFGICLIMLFSVSQQHLTVVRAAGSYTHSVLSDFEQPCALFDNTVVTGIGDGAIIAGGNSSALFDSFEDVALNATMWEISDWRNTPPTYAPLISEHKLTLTGGGALISDPTNGYGFNLTSSVDPQIFEAVASFTGTQQHIGFADTAFSHFVIISTMGSTTELFARVNHGLADPPTPVSLGAIPSGPHIYRIESVHNTTNLDISFFIDGVKQTTISVLNSNMDNIPIALSNNDLNQNNLTVNSVTVWPKYKTTSHYTSCAIDAGASNTWTHVSWVATVPTNTSLTVQYKTSTDGVTFPSSWTTVTASGDPVVTPARFIKYYLTLNTSAANGLESPVIEAVTLTTSGTPPTNTPTETVTPTTVTPTTVTPTTVTPTTVTPTTVTPTTVTPTTVTPTTVTPTTVTPTTVTPTTTLTPSTTPTTTKKYIFLPLVIK